MTLNEALNCKFFRDLMEDQHKLSDNVGKKKGLNLWSESYHVLTVPEKKITATFNYVTDLITMISDIHTTYRLINRFPAKSYLEKHDISELEYIKYHYESYMHKVHTILEIMKLIANEVLNINLPAKDCNWNNLITDEYFNKSKCKRFIEDYYTDFKNIINYRHLNSHRGVFEDKEMDEISFTLNAYRWSKKHNMEIEDEYKRAFPYFYLQIKLNRFKKDKFNELVNAEQKIFEHVKKFLESLNWKK